MRLLQPWISPLSELVNITTVWKPDKKSVQVCLDSQDLNLLTLDNILPWLKGAARVFSLLDVKDGFLQVHVI